MSAPTVIEVSGVHKSFRMPTHRVETLKERALHPLRSAEYAELRALEDVSCEMRAGEFVGIAGRNGSGKTTLLKLLASIYRPDRGKIRMAGRVAPFIELGVGFNPDLAAEDNVLLNGVMMGLTPKEARQRYDRVMEFAELEDFAEMKLKNYSSGMRVRLGFAMLVAADADILLIDEVLAVGDASFQRKCTDSFYRLRDAGKTIVLVTHEMEKLKQYCDRAVLLHQGLVDRIGNPDEVGQRYLELNFRSPSRDRAAPADQDLESMGPARIAEFTFEDDSGRPVESFAHGQPIRYRAVIETTEELEGPCLALHVYNEEAVRAFAVQVRDVMGPRGTLHPGERLHIRGQIENPLSSGQYTANVVVTRDHDFEDRVAVKLNASDFLIFGAEAPGGFAGVITPHHELRVEHERVRELAPR
jgi:ABC-2 type transport system ATP-binding protein